MQTNYQLSGFGQSIAGSSTGLFPSSQNTQNAQSQLIFPQGDATKAQESKKDVPAFLSNTQPSTGLGLGTSTTTTFQGFGTPQNT